jgi:hypothetical protein
MRSTDKRAPPVAYTATESDPGEAPPPPPVITIPVLVLALQGMPLSLALMIEEHDNKSMCPPLPQLHAHWMRFIETRGAHRLGLNHIDVESFFVHPITGENGDALKWIVDGISDGQIVVDPSTMDGEGTLRVDMSALSVRRGGNTVDFRDTAPLVNTMKWVTSLVIHAPLLRKGDDVPWSGLMQFARMNGLVQLHIAGCTAEKTMDGGETGDGGEVENARNEFDADAKATLDMWIPETCTEVGDLLQRYIATLEVIRIPRVVRVGHITSNNLIGTMCGLMHKLRVVDVSYSNDSGDHFSEGFASHLCAEPTITEIYASYGKFAGYFGSVIEQCTKLVKLDMHDSLLPIAPLRRTLTPAFPDMQYMNALGAVDFDDPHHGWFRGGGI